MCLFGSKPAVEPDRRMGARRPANARGVICAPGLETACLIVDLSTRG